MIEVAGSLPSMNSDVVAHLGEQSLNWASVMSGVRYSFNRLALIQEQFISLGFNSGLCN